MPLRILCLHGFSGKSSVLPRRLPPALHAHDLVFIDGPHAVAPGRAWWRAQTRGGQVVYEGWDETKAYLAHVFESQGPFDGVLGFSQGAVLTGVLCALQHQSRSGSNPSASESESKFDFSFAVMIGGFLPRDASLRALFPSPSGPGDAGAKLDVPSLHVWGRGDDVVPPAASERLAGVFNAPATIVHSGGHVVPAHDGWQVFLDEQMAHKACGAGRF